MLGSGCQARRLSQLNHQHQGGGFCWFFFFLKRGGGVVFFLFLIYDFRLLRQWASSRITLRHHPRAATEARARGGWGGGDPKSSRIKRPRWGGFIHQAAVASIFGERGGGINPPLLRSDSAFPLLTSSSFRLIHDAAAGFHLPPSCCLRNMVVVGKRHQPPRLRGAPSSPGPPHPAPRRRLGVFPDRNSNKKPEKPTESRGRGGARPTDKTSPTQFVSCSQTGRAAKTHKSG